MKKTRASVGTKVLIACMASSALAVDPSPPAKGPRFAPLTYEQLNVYQKPLGEQILKVSSVGLGGPYNPLLRSPVLGQRMFDLLYYLRWNSSLPLRLNEMAILITGRVWRSQVEWYAHAPLAIKAGLSPEIVADLAHDDRTRVETDSHLEAPVETRRQLAAQVTDAALDREGGVSGAPGRVLVRDRRAEQGHDPVAGVLIDRALEPVHLGREKEPPFKPGDP